MRKFRWLLLNVRNSQTDFSEIWYGDSLMLETYNNFLKLIKY